MTPCFTHVSRKLRVTRRPRFCQDVRAKNSVRLKKTFQTSARNITNKNIGPRSLLYSIDSDDLVSLFLDQPNPAQFPQILEFAAFLEQTANDPVNRYSEHCSNTNLSPERCQGTQ